MIWISINNIERGYIMLKKLVSVLLSVVLLFALSTTSYAQGFNVNMPDDFSQLGSDVMPCFEYTNTTYTSLSISNSGVATCSTSLNGYSGTTTKIVIKMTLQSDSWLWWSTEKEWTTTINNWYGSFVKSTNVDSGTYRVKVEYTVYSGSKSEEITTYSQEKEF